MAHPKETVVVLLVASLVAMAPARPATPDPEGEVRALLEEYAASASALDWDRLLGLYADDARFHWMESGQLAYDGRDSVVEQIRTLAPIIERFDFEILEPRVLVLSPEHAHASMRFREKMTLVSGEALELEGAITTLLLRTEAGWRLLAGHTSISPAPEPPTPEA